MQPNFLSHSARMDYFLAEIKKITKFLLGQEKCDEDHIFKTRADLLLHTNNQTYECFYKRQ